MTNLELLEVDIHHYIQWSDESNRLTLNECKQLATDLAKFVDRVLVIKGIEADTKAGIDVQTITPISRIDSLANLFVLTQQKDENHKSS